MIKSLRFAAFVLVAIIPSIASTTYTILDLGSSTHAFSINDAGQVAGIHNNSAAVYINGIWTDLGLGVSSSARSINNAGDVAAISDDRAYRIIGGSSLQLPTFDNQPGDRGLSLSIDSSGTVLGNISSATGGGASGGPFFYSGGVLTNINSLIIGGDFVKVIANGSGGTTIIYPARSSQSSNGH